MFESEVIVTNTKLELMSVLLCKSVPHDLKVRSAYAHLFNHISDLWSRTDYIRVEYPDAKKEWNIRDAGKTTDNYWIGLTTLYIL